MLFFELEDLDSSVEVLCFPKTTEEYGPLVREDSVMLVSGRVDNRGDEVKVVAATLKELELRSDDTVRIELPARLLSAEKVKKLKQVLVNHPGTAPVLLHMTSETGMKILKLGDEHRVEPRSALYAELRELLGPRAVI